MSESECMEFLEPLRVFLITKKVREGLLPDEIALFDAVTEVKRRIFPCNPAPQALEAIERLNKIYKNQRDET